MREWKSRGRPHPTADSVCRIFRGRIAAISFALVAPQPPTIGVDGGARAYYEEEALRGGWSVRQRDRQIATLTF